MDSEELWSRDMGVKREGIERIEERYLRWILKMDNKTPEYMVREES